MKDLAFVVHTVDHYKHVWPGWHKQFTEYFKQDIPVYFMNEESSLPFDEFKQIKTGYGEWSDRLRRGLESIPEKNIIYSQEDFWLFNKLTYLDEFYELFLKENFKLLRLSHPANGYKLSKPKYMVRNHGIRMIEKDSDFLISHQMAFWDKNTFLSVLDRSENPWVHEPAATNRIRSTLDENNTGFYMAEVIDWYWPIVNRSVISEFGHKLINNQDIYPEVLDYFTKSGYVDQPIFSVRGDRLF